MHTSIRLKRGAGKRRRVHQHNLGQRPGPKMAPLPHSLVHAFGRKPELQAMDPHASKKHEYHRSVNLWLSSK